MSVYKPKGSRFYQYDFRLKGRRFHGPTGQETKRAAQEVERKIRLDAALGKLNDAAQYTLDQGAGRWFQEVGQHLSNPEETARILDRLLVLVGKDMKLCETTTRVVARAVETRRGMRYAKSPKPGAQTYAPSNATVNRDVIDALRPILRRAARVWEAQGLPEVNWKDLRLPEPREIVRTYSEAERGAWASECDPATAFALTLLLTYGLRFGELFFHPDDFQSDENGARLLIRKRKRDVPLVIPLRGDDARQVAARVGRAKAAKLECVWFEEASDGELIEMTYHGMHARLESAARRAGIKPGRVIHGTRHHAGTAIVRRTKSVKMAKDLLGHVSMSSTLRYTHAMEDDLRAALEGESRVFPEAAELVVGKVKRRKG